ncbi:unnamed protein product [Sphagnum jensenii]|uniref:Uncharacterized protein n=1 Tax=Sphagnum jensenii TaxID=128206 RepID=A0ABP0VGI0_9BRYO
MSEVGTFGTAEAQDLCWQNVPGMVTGDANASLISSLSLEEVGRAIRALPKGKASSHDGVSMEFFHECEQEITPDLLQAFTALLNEGETSAFINKRIINSHPEIWRPREAQ